MKSFVISLARTPDRLARFYELNGHQDRIGWFDAIDGRQLDFSTLERIGIIQPGFRAYSLGSIGCAISHQLLWKLAIKLNEPITILEDDAILNHRFFELAEELADAPGGGYDFIQWGWNFDSILSFHLPGNVSRCTAVFNQDDLRRNVAAFRTHDAEHHLYKLHSAFGIMAYTVSPGGAEKLLKRCFPLAEEAIYFDGLGRAVPNYGIDIVMNAAYRLEDARCFVCFPSLAASRNEHEVSTIRGAGQA